MSRINSVLKKIGLALLTLPILLGSPAISLADVPTTPNSSVAPSNGPIDQTYKYNETTGKWENDRYVWDPITHTTTPKDPPAATNTSEKPDVPAASTSTNNAPQSTSQSNGAPGGSTAQSASTSSGPTVTQATPQQNIAIPSNGTQQNIPNNTSSTTNAGLDNTIGSASHSGDATISQNTSAGNAASGNSTTASTIINALQSSASIDDLSKVATFTTNIDGNVVGDLYIDPHAILAVQKSTNTDPPADIKINNQTSNAIDNKINVGAGSGNATVSDNTTAGDATSGNANAVVNLVNVLNSAIAANQSFLGLININGNFDGDILLPPGTLNALLASNNGSNVGQNNLTVSSNDVNNIANNVGVNATSGNATVANNTTAGNATTGNASTNVTILNLTGHEIVGSNSLLVFVNVLGRWVGAIVDAPAGSTAAAIGGGVTQDNTLNSDVSLSTTNANRINNDVNVDAHSGDASVRDNTTAGGARTGNASASANIANIANSSLSLSDWFGILFINVFGMWNGSFGIDTAAGNKPTPSVAVAGASATDPGSRVFRFAPNPAKPVRTAKQQIARASTEVQLNQTEDFGQETPAPTLGVNTSDDNHNDSQPGAKNAVFSPTRHSMNVAASAVVAGAILIGIERTMAYRDSRKLRHGQL